MVGKKVFCVVVLALLLAGCGGFGLLGEITAESSETQSVIVNGVPDLTIDHFGGTLTVRDGEEGKITANLTRQSRAKNADNAQAQLDEITMEFTQSGTNVTLDVNLPNNLRNLRAGPSGILEVEVPPGTRLEVNLGAGDIVVEEPSGDIDINGGAGTATVTMPADASFRLEVSGGVADVKSEFEGVPSGGVAAAIETTIGSNPTQTLTFNLGAGDIFLKKAP